MASKDDFLGEIETIIIGGGQAGLSVGRYLKEYNREFLILEKSELIGASWRERYDSLELDSFVKYSYLEGFPFPGDPMRKALKEEVVTYLQSFAKNYNIIPKFSTEVLGIEKVKGEFVIKTNKGIYHSRFVVLATGPFHRPHTPKNAENIPENIFQVHSKFYKNPSMLRSGPTLVVGGGNSGAEIAEEVALSGREVYFSFKGKFKSVKSSRLTQWMAYRLGLAHVPRNSLLGRIIIWYTKGKPVGVDVKKLFKNRNLISVGEFKGEVPSGISNIIWATGYESDFSIVSIPDFKPLEQKRGETNIPGLYVLNIRWQHTKSSSHLAGVGRDAKYIAKHIISNIKP